MNTNRLRVSLVIPAYNEEGQLHLCLDAVARQTVAPFEVIMVDNNSTDATAAIARRYPFVRVVREPRQGLLYARTRGYEAARGEIIGRIDADSIVADDWVERLQAMFADASVDAVVGSIGFFDVPFEPFFGWAELFCRTQLARRLRPRREMFLYGGNMGLRRRTWRQVRHQICYNTTLHEDQDLAAHLAGPAYNVLFEPTLHVRVSARRIDSPPGTYCAYVFANSRTFKAHHLRGRVYMYPVEILVAVLYLPLRLLYRAYDPVTGKLSFRRTFQPSGLTRVSPVSESL